MKQKNKNQPFKTVLIFIGSLAAVSAGYIGAVLLYQYFNPPAEKTPVTQQVVNSNAPSADIEASEETEITPDTLNNYTVAADMPRFLSIEKLNMKARIQPMGINSVGAVQAPVNINDSGWYKGSAKPGTQGAAFIDGHASGSTRQGLFAYIDTLKNGDMVKVEQGDGTVFEYKVVYIETVSKDAVDMNKALAVYGGAAEGLNLMTCTGKWMAKEETYDKRVVVYTERVV